MDFVGWKILLEVPNKLTETLFTVPDRGSECTIELAVKQELSVLGIETNDIGRHHINGEIRREPRNVFSVILRKLVSEIACHEVSTRTLPNPNASARRILRQRSVVKLARRRFSIGSSPGRLLFAGRTRASPGKRYK
jgi:hypothetical protein